MLILARHSSGRHRSTRGARVPEEREFRRPIGVNRDDLPFIQIRLMERLCVGRFRAR